MSDKISKSEIQYNRNCSEEDRQREIKRQRAMRDVRAQASMFRALPTEPAHRYTNSGGYSVSLNCLPLSLI